jgi:toxin-antitoxin system PIN domain toxin
MPTSSSVDGRVIVPDANLLLYAYDSRAPQHEGARDWWASTLSGREPVGLTHPVTFAFVRIATSARVYENPMSLAEAASHVRSWTSRSVTRVLSPDADHIDRVLDLLQRANSSGGNLVTDAQIAALAQSHRAVVHTADHDFRRFPDVECHFPLDE